MQCLIPNACADKALCCAFCKEKCADRCKDKPNGCKYFSAEKYERKKEEKNDERRAEKEDYGSYRQLSR